VVELNEAAKLRSAKEEADRLAKGDVEAQISSNIVRLVFSILARLDMTCALGRWFLVR
jgi:hypothetical protein